MRLKVQDRYGTLHTYSDVDIAEGELVVNKKLSSDGGREQLENDDVEIAIYGSFLGFDTPDEFFDSGPAAATLSVTGIDSTAGSAEFNVQESDSTQQVAQSMADAINASSTYSAFNASASSGVVSISGTSSNVFSLGGDTSAIDWHNLLSKIAGTTEVSIDNVNSFSGTGTLAKEPPFHRHLRAQLSNTEYGIQIEGSIYEADISYDEVDDKWIVLLLGDAEEEVRERLREIDVREVVDASTGDTATISPHTTGAPVSEAQNGLYNGTIRHKDGDETKAVLDEWAGWQTVGACNAWRPYSLLEQVLPPSVEVSTEHTSAHATTPETGLVPLVPPPSLDYTSDDGTVQTVNLKPTYIFSIIDWSEPADDTNPDNVRGTPAWTGEEALDYYLKKTGRRLITRYRAFPSDTLEVVFADDSTDVQTSGDLDTSVPTGGLAPGDPREQGFYEADISRPRFPDLAVQTGEIFEDSLEASEFGFTEHLDVRQYKINRGGEGASPTFTGWYSPDFDEEPQNKMAQVRETWRSLGEPAYDNRFGTYPDLFVAMPQPTLAKYASERWGVGRDRKVVEENENTVQMQTKPAQILMVMDTDQHSRGGSGFKGLFNHTTDLTFDPWRDPCFLPMTTNGYPFQRGWNHSVTPTNDVHNYTSQSFPSTLEDPIDYKIVGKNRSADTDAEIRSLDGVNGPDPVDTTDLTHPWFIIEPEDTPSDVAQKMAGAIVDAGAYSNNATASGDTVTIEGMSGNSIDLYLEFPVLTTVRTYNSSANELEIEIISKREPAPTTWNIQQLLGWPIIPYESEEVYEVAAVQTTSYAIAGHCVLWRDVRKPGTATTHYDDRKPWQTVSQGEPDVLATDGIARDPGEGLHGLDNSTWAKHTWELREASTSPRIVQKITADITGLDFEVGDPNRGLKWRGYNWLVTQVEQQADRPIATLTLERYTPNDRQLYSEGQPTLAAPRNAKTQKTLTHRMRKGNDGKGDALAPPQLEVLLVSWDPPRYEDQAAVWYYSVQRRSFDDPSGTVDGFYWRQAVTTGTKIYLKTVSNTLTYRTSFRIRSVGFPDQNGDVETSDWTYVHKRNPRVLREKRLPL